jgi:hypothetical protein
MRATLTLPFLALVVAVLAAAPATAQSALEFILQEQKKVERERVAPRSVEPQGPVGPAAVSVPMQRTYCVRTCDGYYFAIGFVRRESDLEQHGAMCAAACTGAEMKLFSTPVGARTPEDAAGASGPAINSAADATGQLYTALPAAFRFRDGVVPGCTCQGVANGLPHIPLTADPTLRPGDIVVMAEGLKVFRGQSSAQHQLTDFEAVADSRSLSGVVRQQLLSLENRIAQ